MEWSMHGRLEEELSRKALVQDLSLVRLLRTHVEIEGMNVRVEGHYRQGQKRCT